MCLAFLFMPFSAWRKEYILTYHKKNTQEINFCNTKRAALYVRVSTKYQIDKDSLPFQRKKLIEYCNILGIEEYEIFEDDGYSAKNMDRPRYKDMMNSVRNGKFSHIIVWKVDRISRNLLDFAKMYEELKIYRCAFVSMNEQFDTSTAIGEAMLKIILIFAELERKMTSERVTGIMINRAENGLWNGARMPVGYRWNPETKFPEPDPDEIKIVQFIFDEYERVNSCTQIFRYLNNNNIQTKRGGHWTSKLIHDIIRNPFYIGTYRYNLRESGRGSLKPQSSWIIKENNHKGIISKEQFERCNKIMDKNATDKNMTNFKACKFIHIFSNHLICAKCGANMTANKDRARLNGYRPSIYSCSKRKTMKTCDNSKTINENYLRPFIFNYIANLAYIQKNFHNIKSLNQLEKELLQGNIFNQVHSIKKESLQKTFDILSHEKIGKGKYIPDIDYDEAINYYDAPDKYINLLEKERIKCKNAISKLIDLYLYNSDSMTEKEYIIKKKELNNKISKINNQIATYNTPNNIENFVDIAFIKKTTAFLVIQHILSKKYIDYVEIAIYLDDNILKDFIDQVIDKIYILEGRITKIRFSNGLEHEFIYTLPAERPVCKKCGGHIGSTCGCRSRTFRYKGKQIKRIKVGHAGDTFENNPNVRCSECLAQYGIWHHWNCNKEKCPICGEQLMLCEHGKEDD